MIVSDQLLSLMELKIHHFFTKILLFILNYADVINILCAAPINNTHLHQFQFIMERVKTIERDSVDVTWLVSD